VTGNPEEPWFAALDRTWTPVLTRWNDDPEPLAVLFSGGIDSGLLAWELRDRPGTTLHTVGTGRSNDLAIARGAADALHLPWSGFEVARSDLDTLVERLSQEFASIPSSRRSILLSLAVAISRAPESHLLCGQGADELFLGYAHFQGLSPSEASERSEDDLRQLLAHDWPWTERIAARLGRRISAPYLDPGFREAARSIPIHVRLPRSAAKAFFRRWARHRGLPEAIATRPKRALQFSSGIDRLMKNGRARDLR